MTEMVSHLSAHERMPCIFYRRSRSAQEGIGRRLTVDSLLYDTGCNASPNPIRPRYVCTVFSSDDFNSMWS